MFLKIKKIPIVSWSSEEPYNFKPKLSTLFFLCFGLMLFGLGEGLLIVSFTGASPWSVLAQGISLNINLTIGTITLLISIAVLILWIPLGQKPGMGTIFNALIIALMIDLCIKFVPTPSNYFYQLILAIISVLLVGIGGGIYLVSNLGAGPRDGLMIGLQKISNFPIALVRAFLEISVVSVGWYLGGTVGVGTLLFAFGIGPCVALGLYLVDRIFN
jgi:uncharacterized membrane protein YczE|tara:strand:+ start:1128 stop:1775 length:648 start_codon:yes stop_codon:yes gene_type:complete